MVGRRRRPPAFPDPGLAARLRAALGDSARSEAVASLDVLHPSSGHATPDGSVADMQTAALFAAGARLGIALAAVLVVTDAEGHEALDDESLAARAATAARAAAFALFTA